METNIDRATKAFVTLAKAGFAPMCPHWSVYSKPTRAMPLYSGRNNQQRIAVMCEATVAGNDEMTHEDWLGVDLPWVAVSDAVLRLPGESMGADRETALAYELKIPVYHSVEQLITELGPKVAATKAEVKVPEPVMNPIVETLKIRRF